ncbi:MAG: LPP20 family lipoprotein [Prevotella sp.]|nr:LPP20 family lipoprotein [Prevotella sp.]
MKKYLLILIAGLLFSVNMPAQNILNTIGRALNGLSQQGQQRNNQRYNNQRTYPYNRRPNRQYGIGQQRREIQQRNIYQQQDNTVERNESPNSVNNTVERDKSYNNETPSDINNQTPNNDKTISLVTSGTGNTREEAIRNALRNAIEQAFGTFVSANTEVLNDDLIKDEIVTVSSGNIKSYRELSVSQLSSGLYDVTVQAVVSIDQLTKFAQSKGMQAELAGASFMMNMKMRELNKKNEDAAINHMIEKTKAIARNGLFDYKLEIGEPQLTSNSNYAVKITILFCENENTKAFYSTIYDTFKALSMNKTEIAEYERTKIPYFFYDDQLRTTKKHIGGIGEVYYDGVYALRNSYEMLDLRESSYSAVKAHTHTWIMPLLMIYALNYEIKDNLGNIWSCDIKKNKKDSNNRLIWCYKTESINNDINQYYYILSPSDRIVEVWDGIHMRSCGYDLEVPIHDYRGKTLHFNPLLEDRTIHGSKNSCLERKNSGIYYSQEFNILYTPDELSKLNSITINHRQ